MAIRININGVDKTSSIDRKSLKIDNILTRQIDRCKFIMRKYGNTHTYVPTVGREVTVYDGTTKVFGGNIVKITQRSRSYKLIEFEVECHDYGRQLDRYLINDSFENQTIADIIDYIITDKGLDTAGFTTNNVDCSHTVAYVGFKYETFSSVLTQLADLINYDWYVDYDKDIHFFAKDKTPAPFDIQDDNGSYIFESLVIRRDNSQVRNVIYVRGGEYLGDTFTSEYKSVNSGGVQQNVFNLPYKYDALKVNVTGEIWDGGIDGVDVEGNYDYMWNNEEKFIKIRSDRIPSDGASIRVSGRPYLPVVVKLRDPDSIDSMVSAEGGTGEYEHIIIDKSIDSREGARERARAELEAYATTISEGEFSTYNSGLKAGMRIRINSSAHNIDEYYIINRVSYEPWTEDKFVYKVSLVTTKTYGIIDFLRGLTEKDKKKIVINEDEILDVVEAYDEIVSISETTTASTEHNLQGDAVNINETTTAQSLNYNVQFVIGPYIWGGEGSGDTKRVFILNGSYLG